MDIFFSANLTLNCTVARAWTARAPDHECSLDGFAVFLEARRAHAIARQIARGRLTFRLMRFISCLLHLLNEIWRLPCGRSGPPLAQREGCRGIFGHALYGVS